MWNIAADGKGNPKLPGTKSCGGPGCHPLVTVNRNGSYAFNQECALLLAASLCLRLLDTKLMVDLGLNKSRASIYICGSARVNNIVFHGVYTAGKHYTTRSHRKNRKNNFHPKKAISTYQFTCNQSTLEFNPTIQ